MPDMDLWPTARLLTTAARLVEQVWNEKLRGVGLTHAGVAVLDVLAVTGPLTQARLAGILRVRAQTVGPALRRLESRGYVRRVRTPSDRRNNLMAITKEGTSVLEEARRLECSVLANVAVDTGTLRNELQTIVRGLPSPTG